MKVQPRPLVRGPRAGRLPGGVLQGLDPPTASTDDHVGDSADTLLKWHVAPLAAGAVILVVVATALGWWRPAMLRRRAGRHGGRWSPRR